MVNVYDRADGSGHHITCDTNPNRHTDDEIATHLRQFLDFLAETAIT